MGKNKKTKRKEGRELTRVSVWGGLVFVGVLVGLWKTVDCLYVRIFCLEGMVMSKLMCVCAHIVCLDVLGCEEEERTRETEREQRQGGRKRGREGGCVCVSVCVGVCVCVSVRIRVRSAGVKVKEMQEGEQ